MLDPITSMLFEDSFPREIGAKRNLVTTREQFERKLDMINGVDEAFTNANPLNGNINKIFLDFDGPNSLIESQILYTYLLSNGIPCIPIASGKKGIHLYIILKERRGQDNKETLYKTTKSLLLKALPENKSVDPHVIGDLRRLCRIPNTLRPPENNAYCTYLPIGKAFLEMKNIDMMWYTSGVHIYNLKDYNIDFRHLPTFDELIIPEVDDQQVKFESLQPSFSTVTYADNEHLKRLLRPCIYRLLTVEEPRHHVRVAATVDLLRGEIPPQQILDMYRSLHWRDWDENWTTYQINHIKLIPYHKRRLKNLGICYECGRSCF